MDSNILFSDFGNLPYDEWIKRKQQLDIENEKELLRQEKERCEGFIWGLKNNCGIKEELTMSEKMKIEVEGYEALEKEVKESGNSGRVYAPHEWVGKKVKLILLEPLEK